MTTQTNTELKLAFDFVQYTHEHIFLTGKAGTGKTTFLHHLKEQPFKKMIVVAPTGVAAINAGGVTIHSFFQLPFGPIIPNGSTGTDHHDTKESPQNSRSIHRFSRAKIDIIRSLDLLVIDEVSMVRADLLDGVDEVLRRFRRNNKPFGGVQLLMIGDMHQLAPVIKDDEWQLLKDFYTNGFFFSSRALQKTNYVSIELKNIFRQSDEDFISLLNKVRDGVLDDDTLSKLNRRYKPDEKYESDAIILTTHNHQSQTINNSKLNELPGKAFSFSAMVEGDFPESSYPMDFKLVLKRGSQVMFNKNDSSGNREYFNGKIGTVSELSDDAISVRCPGDDHNIEVGPEMWENVKYDINDETKEIKERIIGTFQHFPLKLAWAITIHKSQGLTFDKAVIDARSAFAFGQVYVALSRCRTLEGMILSSPISRSCIKNDENITSFANDIGNNEPTPEKLGISRLNYQKQLLEELFDYNNTGRRLNLIRKLARENEGSFSKTLLPAIQKLINVFESEIVTISQKFMLQLNWLMDKYGVIEKNGETDERIKKAGNYFSEKTESVLLAGIRELPLGTDNKELRKTISETKGQLVSELEIKLICLRSLHSGWDLHDYLQTRAKAALNDSPKSPSQQSEEDLYKNLKHPELYKMLKNWRDRKAKELRLSTARIIRQPVLEEIANAMPMNIRDCLKIKGFGAQKRKLYTSEILNIVLDYLKASGADIPEDPAPGTRYKGDTKVRSSQLSYDMFISGMPIIEIAEERGLSKSTIDGHLAEFVESGKIEIERIVSPEKIQLITEYFLKSESKALSAARLALGEDISYAELRMVLSCVKN